MQAMGVWMSREVLAHKRQQDVAVQVWNFRRLPEGFATARAPGKLFVAVDGYWRGFFRTHPVLYNPEDARCPYAVPFNPRSWTPMLPHRAPPRNRLLSYTLDLPPMETIPTGERKGTNLNNEINELWALLEREEKRE